MPTIADIKQQYPFLNNLDDNQVVDALHGAFYQDRDRQEVADALGVKAPEKPNDHTRMGDMWRSFKSGVEELPGMVTGFLDIPTALTTGDRPFSKMADVVGNATGFQPGKWAKEATAAENMSAGSASDQKDVEDAWKDVGAVEKDPNSSVMDIAKQVIASSPALAKAYATHPFYTINQVMESLPSMIAGGVISKGLMGAGSAALRSGALKAGAMGPEIPGLLERKLGEKVATEVAGGAGEGAVQAGQAMDQADQDDPTQAAQSAVGSGVGDAAIAMLAGRIAHKMGLETLETRMAGSKPTASERGIGLAKRMAGGMATEGVLQEVPQSAQEQLWQNYADGKPLMDGVMRQAIEGGLSGAVMGAGANVTGGGEHLRQDTPGLPNPDQTNAPPGAPPAAPPATPGAPGAQVAPVQPSAPPVPSGPLTSAVIAGGLDPNAPVLTDEQAAAHADALDVQAKQQAEAQKAQQEQQQAAADEAKKQADAALKQQQEQEKVAQSQREQQAQAYYDQAKELVKAGQVDMAAHHVQQGDAILRGEQPVPYRTDEELKQQRDNANAPDVRNAIAQELQRRRNLNAPVEGASAADDTKTTAPAAETGATAPNVEQPAAPAALPTDILNPKGKPFASKGIAMVRANKLGDGHTVVAVDGGFAVRKTEQAPNVQDHQAAPQGAETQAPATQAPEATRSDATTDGTTAQPGAQPAGVEAAGVAKTGTPTGKWFTTADRARDYLAKKGLQDTHSVEADPQIPKRFNIVKNATEETNGTQAPEAQQAKPQAPATADQVANPGDNQAQWTRMATVDRLGLATRAGLTKVQADFAAKRPWMNLSPRVQEKLNHAMLSASMDRQVAQSNTDAIRSSNQDGIRSEGAQAHADGKERVAPAFLTGQSKDLWHEGWDGAAKQAAPVAEQPSAPKTEPRAMTHEGRAVDGGPIKGGDVFSTASGRATTPYPSQKGERFASQWLIDNAIAEAKERGDDFNATGFGAEKPGKGGTLPPASVSSMQEYLFGEQPKVVPSILKPMVSEKPAVSANTIFTDEAAAAARARLKAKLARLGSGIDPEMMMDGITLAGNYIEKGARTFAAYAKAMIDDLGEGVKPYLRSWYMGVKYDPRAAAFEGMDNAATVEAHDLDKAPQKSDTGAPENEHATRNLDSPSTGALEGTPAENVRPPEESGNAGAGTDQGGGRDSSANAAPDGAGIPASGRLGNEPGAVPVPTGGTRANAKNAKKRGVQSPRSVSEGTGTSGPAGGVTPEENHAPNAPPVPAPQIKASDFTIDDDLGLGEGGQKTKFRNNVAAIRLIAELEKTGRLATPDEQKVLAKYVGWGGLSQAFDASNPDWAKEHAELKELMSPADLAAARKSTRYAHYTSKQVVQDGIYAAMRQFGYSGGKTLEAGAGVGNFMGLMPDDMRTAGRFTAIEREPFSSAIAKQLYPNQNVQQADFTEFKGNDAYFDAAVGNPPFASDPQTDRSGRKHLSGLSLHNYFFAKAVDMLRPGGLLAQVVTNSFLDAKGDTARKYIGERVKFLGAIRLPNNAFSKNANTEVTTDIIFLQKRPDGEIGGKEAKADAKRWADVGTYTDRQGKRVALNQYFIDNPHMMLGDYGAFGTMYGPDQPALVARPGQDTLALLKEAVSKLPQNVYQSIADTRSHQDAAVVALKNPTVQEGGYFSDGDKLMQRLPDLGGEARATEITPETQWTEKTKLGQSGFERIKALSDMRTTVRSLISAEMADNTKDMEGLRKTLNEQYDAYRDKHGLINDPSTLRVFDDDPDFPLLASLEHGYTPGTGPAAAKKLGIKPTASTAKKGPIFNQRVVAAREKVKAVQTPADALQVSMAERGRLDADYIGKLLGQDPHEVLKELSQGEKPLLFLDPATNEYVLRDAYLSGNVRAKLDQARSAAMFGNIKALEAVQPEDVAAHEISARIGSPWVPTSVYEDFAKSLFGDETQAAVQYQKVDSSFQLVVKKGSDVALTNTWGTSAMSGDAILNALMNNRTIKVTYRDNEGKTHTDVDATEKANGKAAEIKARFNDWLFSDPDRSELLARAYNDTNNNYVTREYDGSHMTFPGKVPDSIIKFRRHQRNAIARIVQDRTALLDHVVGAGKTFTVVAGAMELKRTGLSNKPLVAVPNHLVKQWAADFYRLYPGANVLTATKKDFEKANRRKFLAKIATGDWDAVVMAHSSFGFIRPSAEFENQFNQGEIQKIMQTIKAVEDGDGDKQQKKRTVKQLEALQERLENRIKALRDRPMDDLLDFGQLGVDQLFVDEAHMFKNLMFSTKMNGVQGLGDSAGSQRAYDMYLKTNEVYNKNGRGQGVVFATGTPVSNSLAEMYHMMRYLMPDQMKAQGFDSFDAWANTFASVDQVWMQSPSGDGYKASNRMSNFVNTPDLLKMFDQVADTVTMDDIKQAYSEENDGAEFPLPALKGGRRTPLSLDKSPAQEAYMQDIARRASVIESRKGPPKKGDDNILSVMGDARKAAMDIRLVQHEITQREKGGRIDRATDEVVNRYKQYNDVKGTQLVFSDLGTPIKQAQTELKEYQALKARIDAATEDIKGAAALGDEKAQSILEDVEAAQEELQTKGADWLGAVQAAMRGFSVYDDFKKALIEKGIPANEIAFIHDYNTDDQKADLFRKMNAGQMRVLLGSTQKLGAGTNVQERLVALHHLDVPWRPSDLEQREGRIIRQGNKLMDQLKDFETEILAYVTKDTLDLRMWQTQETKLKTINQLRTGKVGREIDNAFEDMELSAGEMQAAATGNPDLLKEIQLRTEIKQMEQRKRSFDGQRNDLITRKKRNAEKLQRLPAELEQSQDQVKPAQDYFDDLKNNPVQFKMDIDGKTYTDPKEAQDYLRGLTEKREPLIGKDGFPVVENGEQATRAAPIAININGEVIKNRATVGELYSEARGDTDPIKWTVNGQVYRRRSKLENAIRQSIVDSIADETVKPIGRLGDYSVAVEGSTSKDGIHTLDLTLSKDGKVVHDQEVRQVNAADLPIAVIRTAENLLHGALTKANYLEQDLARAKKEAADLAKTEVPDKWKDEAKLDQARKEHARLLQSMKQQNKPDEAKTEDEANPGDDPALSRKTPAPTTPEFKKWFGDSKVVDAEGNPQVMYHGTAQDIGTFRKKQANAIFLTPSPQFAGGFSNDSLHYRIENYRTQLTPEQIKAATAGALEYAKADNAPKSRINDLQDAVKHGDIAPSINDQYFRRAISDQLDAGPNIIPVYVKAENPFDYQNRDQVRAVSRWLIDHGVNLSQQLYDLSGRDNWSTIENPKVQSAIRALGHDGFYAKEDGTRNLAVYDSAQIKSATGNNGNFDPSKGNIAESRKAGAASGMDPRQVNGIVSAIRSKWAGAPDITVASTMEDPAIPQAVRDYDQHQRSLGATGSPEGFLYKGRVYLVADQLNNVGDVARVLFHEALGHVGLRGVFGDALNPILKQLAVLRRADVEAKAAQYGLDMGNEKQRLHAAEEVLAEMAQNKPELGYVQRAIAAIRAWLRANVPGLAAMKLTDNDIIHQFILPARAFIEKGQTLDEKALAPAQIAPAFSKNPDVSFSRAAEVSQLANKVVDKLGETFSHPGKVSWWDKSVGSMFNLAERSPEFKKVFDSVQNFVNDVSYFAAESSSLAPKLLPRLENWRDMLKKPISAADDKAIAAPIFGGTLSWARDENGKAVPLEDLEKRYEGMSVYDKAQLLLRKRLVTPEQLKRWQESPIDIFDGAVRNRFQQEFLHPGVTFTDGELRQHFNLTDPQIALYREFRATVDHSLDTMAKADMLRYGGKDAADLSKMVMDAPSIEDAATLLKDHLDLLAQEDPDRAGEIRSTAEGIGEKAEKIRKLKDQGYAPLSRFGKYTVDAVVDGERKYFSLFESKAASNQMAAKLAAEYGKENVQQGTLSQREFEMFQGITPESLELFGNMLGLDSQGDEAQDKAFQTYLKLTKNNRSAMKRLIHRQGIEGYSQDVGRVLASFVYSNARQTAAGLHMGDLGEAVNAIPKGMGELKDLAIALSQYVKQPREEAQALRGMLFAQYLGGSVASAAVNFTQPLMITVPYLSQYGGAAKALSAWGQAVKDMAQNAKLSPALQAALKMAEEKGVVAPQEVHQLMAQARGAATLTIGDGTKLGNAKAEAGNALRKLALGWGKLFGLAEQANRRSTFIAAFRIAQERGMADPTAFAIKAVNATQFVNNKGNKAQWARGPIGATLMTFKSYNLNYLELLYRMATQNGAEGKKAAALMIGTLLLMSGAGGLPFEEDAEDVMDFIGQRLGYNFSSKMAKKQFLQDLFGQAGAQFVDKGITGLPGSPVDVSGRMGMANMIPGTGLLLKKSDHTSDLMELAGPAGDLAKRAFQAGDQALSGNIGQAALTVLPKAVSNAAKGIDMANTGMYRDANGYKILDTDNFEAFMKGIGFQPQSVATTQEANGLKKAQEDFYNLRHSEINRAMANAMFTGDEAAKQDARDAVQAWNEQNPDQRMVLNMASVMRLVREMRKDKDQRVADTAPKAMRAAFKRDLAQARGQ